MGRFEIEDGRSATVEIPGMRLGDRAQKPQAMTMSEMLRKARSSRKQYRLPGEDGATLRRIAEAIDSIDDLSFEDRKLLFIIEAGRRITNGDYRTGSLLKVSLNSVKAMQAQVEADERRDFFESNRQRIDEFLSLSNPNVDLGS